MSLTRGTHLGLYEVTAPLGAGGMGEVYRARDSRLGRDVAIKILPDTLVADRERLARFEREARLLASLNHPNIAQIYGLEGQDGRDGQEPHTGPFIVMELVVGETLAEKLASQRGLPIAEVVAIARQLIDALDAAHERGIVHRDLKPANLKITAEGTIKVLDFGLAKSDVEGASSDVSQSPTIVADQTRAGVILGTAAYMSPEQARGKPVDKRADIWAFGCLLFEMLTGHLAFSGETVSDIIGAILHKDPKWNVLPGATPPRLRELLKRCLQKDARLRLRDIADARHDLDAPPEITFTPTTRDVPVARAALPWFVAALGLLIGIAAIGWSWMKRPAVAAAVPHLSSAIRVTNTPTSEFGPAISPDGKWVAYYANNKNRTDVMVKYLDSGSTLNLTSVLKMELPTRAGQGGLAISPDGSQIAFAARPDPTFAQYDTWIMPGPVGGTPRKLLATIGSVQWSPDGKLLTYTIAGSSQGDALGVCASDGTDPRVVVSREGGRHVHWPAWSSDGKYIYFIYTYDSWHAEPAETWRVPISGGKPEPVVQTVRRAIYPVPLPGGGLLFAANPTSLDLGLWWQRTPGSVPIPLTNGLGEHTEARITPNGKRLVSTLMEIHQSLVSIPLNGGWSASRPLTDGYSADSLPSTDFRTGKLVFSSSRSGNRNLWISNEDGSGAVPLTTEAAIDDNPVFSHDAQQIAFVSDRGGQRGIWITNAQGGAPRLLAHEVAVDQLSWSPDDKKITFSRPGGDLPVLVNLTIADGHLETIGPPGSVTPAWSPGQDLLAYFEATMEPAPPPSTERLVSRLFLKFVDGKGNAQYPDFPRRPFSNPLIAWSPNGKQLAVLGIAANGPSEVWLAEPQGHQPLKKLTDLPQTVRPRGITWTKEGDRVIVSNQEFNGDIVMYELR